MSEARRKLNKLLRMPPAEIRGRCQEWWHGCQERLALAAGRASVDGSSAIVEAPLAAELFDDFRMRPFHFMAPGDDERARVRSFQEFFPGRVQTIVEQADRICSGSLRLFGEQVALPRFDWHLDWKTKNRFPMSFYRAIPNRNPLAPADAKRVWEINRQQFLLTLGKAYCLTGRARYAKFVVGFIESWIAANPPYRGINWRESLEPALRLLSWVWSLRMIADSDALAESSLPKILNSIALQREHIARHLSFYYSPNTHLLGEALGLFVVASAFPGLGRTRVDAAQALQILEQQLARQVGEDGAGRELSAYYHCYSLEMYMFATILGQQRGIKFSQAWMKQIERMAEFLLAIVRPDGSLARFGDDDGGRTLRLNDEDYYSPRSLLAVAAVLFGRSDFKHAAGELPEEVFWLWGEQGAKRFPGLAKSEPSATQTWFPQARIAVLRSGWGRRDAWLACLDQPMGFIGAGHSHAGFASFELVLDGKPVIVDPGTYTYDPAGPWRKQFRCTEMHNVAQIDGQHYFAPAGPFSWKQSNTVESLPSRREPAGHRIDYRIGDQPGHSIEHARILKLESAHSASIRDEFRGAGAHRLAFWLHWAPGSRLRQRNGHAFTIQIGETIFELSLEGFAGVECQSWEGTNDPLLGWVSPRFQVKVPALTLCFAEKVELPARRGFSIRVLSRRVTSLSTADAGTLLLEKGIQQVPTTVFSASTQATAPEGHN